MDPMNQNSKKTSWFSPRLAFLALFCAVISFSGVREGTEPCVGTNVMSFNIRYANTGDGPNAWTNRKSLVSSTLLFHKADVAGLQEALRSQIKDLEETLPGYAWFGVGRDDGKEGGEFNPVFFRTDKMRLIRQSTFWLSETPDVPGSRSWGAACNRIVTWAEFEDAGCKARFFFFNTHFDHASETARRKSAEVLLRRIDEIAGRAPIVVTGDFNSTERDAAYIVLTGGKPAPLADARALVKAKPYGSSQSFNGFTSELRPGRIIDFIFVRDVGSVLRQGIISEKWDGRFASDHYPVLAEVVIQ